MGSSVVEDAHLLTDNIGLMSPSREGSDQTSARRASLLLRGEVAYSQSPEGSTEGDVATERGGYTADSFGTGIGFALRIGKIAVEDLDTVAVEDGVITITSQHRGAAWSGCATDDATEVGVLEIVTKPSPGLICSRASRMLRGLSFSEAVCAESFEAKRLHKVRSTSVN